MSEPSNECMKCGCRITVDNIGFTDVVANVIAGHLCAECMNRENAVERGRRSVSDLSDRMKKLVDIFLDQPYEKAFETSVAVYRTVNKKSGVMMAKAVVEKMERES